MSDTLKHAKMCIADFRRKHGRVPQTSKECLEIKHDVELMDMMDDAMMEPEFSDEETDWLEA